MALQTGKNRSPSSIRVARDAGKAPVQLRKAVDRASVKARQDVAAIKAKRRNGAVAPR